jgi:rare lipoprotein A
MIKYFLSLGLLLLASCSGDMETPRPGPKRATDKPYKITNSFMQDEWFYPQGHLEYEAEGLASWYGPGFHGKKTSSGEVYNQHAMTAAHRTIPLPAIAKITNIENGKSIVVKVNDRGPFTGDDRIVDLTLAAAKELGFHHKGLARVRIQTLVPESIAYNEKKMLIGEAQCLSREPAENIVQKTKPVFCAKASIPKRPKKLITKKAKKVTKA